MADRAPRDRRGVSGAGDHRDARRLHRADRAWRWRTTRSRRPWCWAIRWRSAIWRWTTVAATVRINGETVATGRGDAVLGNPLNSVVWLARKLQEFGRGIRAGRDHHERLVHAAVPDRAGRSGGGGVCGHRSRVECTSGLAFCISSPLMIHLARSPNLTDHNSLTPRPKLRYPTRRPTHMVGGARCRSQKRIDHRGLCSYPFSLWVEPKTF